MAKDPPKPAFDQTVVLPSAPAEPPAVPAPRRPHPLEQTVVQRDQPPAPEKAPFPLAQQRSMRDAGPRLDATPFKSDGQAPPPRRAPPPPRPPIPASVSGTLDIEDAVRSARAPFPVPAPRPALEPARLDALPFRASPDASPVSLGGAFLQALARRRRA